MVRADYTQTLGNSLLAQSYNSASSQFTILTKNARNLNGVYAAFGKVTEGIEIVEKIYGLEKDTTENSENSSIEKFAIMPIIKKATVETFGTNYGFPDVNEAFDYEGYLNQVFSQYNIEQ